MAGATICTMKLIGAGCVTQKLNEIGNSPFALAIAHKKQQICTFMLPNGYGQASNINLLVRNKRSELKKKIKGLIATRDVHE